MDLKQIRKKLLLTQKELAKEIGIPLVTIQRWEQGNNEPSVRLLRKVKEFCEIKGLNFEDFN